MPSRRARVERLLELRERALETARGQLAAAQRGVAAAAQAHADAESTWAVRAARTAGSAFPNVTALEEAHAHLVTLRVAADAAAARLQAARGQEDAARALCMRAERERRKLSVWLEKLVDLERQAEARKERAATDEVAARTFMRKQS